MNIAGYSLLNRFRTTPVKRRKVEKVVEVAKICQSCVGRCKMSSSVNMTVCNGKEMLNK